MRSSRTSIWVVLSEFTAHWEIYTNFQASLLSPIHGPLKDINGLVLVGMYPNYGVKEIVASRNIHVTSNIISLKKIILPMENMCMI